MTRNYETLDAIVVVAGLMIVGGGVAGLMILRVPSENLAVVSGLLGGLSGTIIGGYAGFRWGASKNDKDEQPVRVINRPDDPVQVEDAKP
jgi:hypothetical protein